MEKCVLSHIQINGICWLMLLLFVLFSLTFQDIHILPGIYHFRADAFIRIAFYYSVYIETEILGVVFINIYTKEEHFTCI